MLTLLYLQLPFVTAYVTYLAAFFYFPLKFLYESDLKCACSFIITCETVSLLLIASVELFHCRRESL